MVAGRRTVVLFVWMLVVALGGVAAALTHTDDNKVATAGRNGASTTTTLNATGSTVPGATVTDPATGDATPSTLAGGDSATTGETAPADTAPPDTTPGARIMPTPGTYTTNNSGSASLNGSPQPVPPQSTYTIEQLPNGDQHQTGDFDLTLRYAPDSASLVSLKIAQANKDFTPAQPLLFVPFPGDRPDPWSWSVTSTDGKTTLNTTAQIVGAEAVDVGGQVVPTFMVDSTINITGDLVGTVHLTAWVSNDYRLAVKQHTVVDVTYNLAVRLQSDTTSVLASLTPS